MVWRHKAGVGGTGQRRNVREGLEDSTPELRLGTLAGRNSVRKSTGAGGGTPRQRSDLIKRWKQREMKEIVICYH